ncbi:MAG: SPASM domain-containing protein [Planctomycetes bacterium]|nr:SPASM domain-containing protein [Planctomycetota bacterium]
MEWFKRILKEGYGAFQYSSWFFRYVRLLLGCNTLRDIKILSIEFSSVCNLRCKYCFLDHEGREKFLDIQIYEKLIKEVAQNPKYRIRAMEWPISGDFLVYKQWKEVIDITKKYWEANPHFRPHIILNENFMLFDEKKIECILQSGIVRQIICSIDGHNAQTFEDMRPPAKFEVVKRNFQTLVRENRKLGHPVWIQINNGCDENSFGKKFSDEMKQLLREADDVTFWSPRYWNESFNKKEKKFYPAKGPCTFVFNNVTLSANGHIAKCCMDLRGTTTYANLANQSLEEIWHSDTRKKFLDLMFKNKRAQIQGCSRCSIAVTNNDNRFNNAQRQVKRLIGSIFSK